MLVPLFPMPDVVLLPGLVLPLYVFEPRYRALLEHVRSSGEPFGVARLLPPRVDGDFQARVMREGSLAYVHEVVDHEDGTASIVVVGGERFEVVSFDASEPYLSARVRVVPLPVGDAAAVASLSNRVLAGLLRAHAEDAERVRAEAPREALLLATYAALRLPLTADQREAVLRASTLEARLSVLASWVPSPLLN